MKKRAMGIRVNHETKSDAVSVDHEKKSAGVRVLDE